MSELMLKSLDYTINNIYETLGVYIGIYNNSHLIFLYNIAWTKYYTRLLKHEIRAIPTLNEFIFINHQFQYGKVDRLSIFVKYGISKHEYLLNQVLTIDDLYYNPKNKNCIMTINRIYS